MNDTLPSLLCSPLLSPLLSPPLLSYALFSSPLLSSLLLSSPLLSSHCLHLFHFHRLETPLTHLYQHTLNLFSSVAISRDITRLRLFLSLSLSLSLSFSLSLSLSISLSSFTLCMHDFFFCFHLLVCFPSHSFSPPLPPSLSLPPHHFRSQINATL